MTYETGDVAIFDKQLGIIGAQPNRFAETGDSGAVVVDDHENAVGLLFCITQGVDVSFANPIVPILTEFAVVLP
jgi:hypothetical protein